MKKTNSIQFKFIYKCLECKDLEELNKTINNYIDLGYSLEECYKNLLRHSFYGERLIYMLVTDIILNGNEEKRNIILKNLYLIENVDEIFENEQILDYIKRNFEHVFQNLKNLKDSLIEKFLKTRDGKIFILNNFKSIIEGEISFYVFQKLLDNEIISDSMLLENKELLLHHFYKKDFTLLIELLKTKGWIKDEDGSLEFIIKQIYPSIKDKDSLRTIEIMYKELLKRQISHNLNKFDIKYLGSGIYNSVYQVGNFAVKVGASRMTPIIKYHRRVIQPLIRQEIAERSASLENDDEMKEGSNYLNYNSSEEKIGTFIEIQNLVDCRWYHKMSKRQYEDELYKIYKELRQSGIVWTDVKPENVGRLLKPNTTNYLTETLQGTVKLGNQIYGNDGKIIGHKVINAQELKEKMVEMEVDDKSVGMIGRVAEPVLEYGELVIIDTDYMFLEDELDIVEDMQKIPPYDYIAYEKRYLRELRNKNKEITR